MQIGILNNPLCLDTSYLVGIFDEADRWHNRAREMDSLLRRYQVRVSYLDCILNELFTVLARRCRERRSPEVFLSLVDQVAQEAPETAITWLYPHLPRWYTRCLGIMRETRGHLSFHDALVMVAMQELDFPALVSFDTGFDRVTTVKRLSSPGEVSAWVGEHR